MSDDSGNKQGNEFSILSEFRATQQESNYRASTINAARRLNIGAAVLVMAASILFTLNDIGLKGIQDSVIVIRNTIALVALASFFICWRAKTWQLVYFSTYLLAAGLYTCVILINLSRPSDYLLHLGVDAVLLIGIFIALPTVGSQILIASSFSIALVVIHYLVKTPTYEMANIVVPGVIVLSNIIGLMASIPSNKTKRELFLLQQTDSSSEQ